MKIFISYSREDADAAQKLCQDFKKFGLHPWIDLERILPGQKWKQIIKNEIKNSSYFIALLSSNSISKKGYVQKELKIALDLYDEFPDTETYILPVRIEECIPIDDRNQRS